MRLFSLSGLPERERKEWSAVELKPGERWPLPSENAERDRLRALRGRGALCSDDRGLASVEYVILLVAVTLGAALLIAAMGPGLLRSFEWQVAVLGLPIP